MNKKFIVSLLILGLFATACGGSSDPEVIKWGFIPADNADALQELSEPFVEFMSDYVGTVSYTHLTLPTICSV